MEIKIKPPRNGMSADQYIRWAIQGLPVRGAKNRPTGTIILQESSRPYVFTAPLTVGDGVSIVSETFTHANPRRGDVNLEVSDDFPEGEPMIEFLPSDDDDHNGNFWNTVGGFSLHSRNRANGIAGGGAQQSLWGAMEINDPFEYGLEIRKGTRSMVLDGINIDADDKEDYQWVRGIQGVGANNVELRSLSFQACDRCLDLDGCNGWESPVKIVAEGCGTMVTLSKGDRNHKLKFAVQDADRDGDIPLLDLSSSKPRRGNVFEGTINKTDKPWCFMPGSAERVTIATQGGSGGSARVGWGPIEG